MSYRGIDYGRGQTNIDRENGIRYGVIAMNDLHEWAWESFEADYGEPYCPKCGKEVIEYDDEAHGHYGEHGIVYLRRGNEYACESCEQAYYSDDCYADEPLGWTLDDGEYQATVDSYGDCFIVLSPYFTRASFCSPCAPGACHLSSPNEDGERCYCFGHDWFDGDVAPYPVFSVKTGERVYSPSVVNLARTIALENGLAEDTPPEIVRDYIQEHGRTNENGESSLSVAIEEENEQCR